MAIKKVGWRTTIDKAPNASAEWVSTAATASSYPGPVPPTVAMPHHHRVKGSAAMPMTHEILQSLFGRKVMMPARPAVNPAAVAAPERVESLAIVRNAGEVHAHHRSVRPLKRFRLSIGVLELRRSAPRSSVLCRRSPPAERDPSHGDGRSQPQRISSPADVCARALARSSISRFGGIRSRTSEVTIRTVTSGAMSTCEGYARLAASIAANSYPSRSSESHFEGPYPVAAYSMPSFLIR